MGISVCSLVSAIVFFNIGLLLVKVFLRNTGFLVRNSTAVLLILVLFSLIRILLPFDFKYAIVLTSQTIFPSIMDVLEISVIKGLNIGTVLLIISIIGSLLVTCKSVYSFIREIQQIKKYRQIEDQRIQKIADECLLGKAVVIVSSDVDVPKVTALRKAYIYMPPLPLTDEEIRLILLHEFQHVQGKDFAIKLFYLFLKAIFWWNPVVHFFYQEVENLLELKCDSAVTKSMTDEERVTYLKAILKVIKLTDLHDTKRLVNAASLVNLKKQNFIQQRFEIILNKSKDYSKSRSVRNICIITILFLCSYFVIVQPVYEPPVNEIGNYVQITNENAYIVIGGNGQLELYVDGEIYGTIENEELAIEPYNDLKIIRKEEGDHE